MRTYLSSSFFTLATLFSSLLMSHIDGNSVDFPTTSTKGDNWYNPSVETAAPQPAPQMVIGGYNCEEIGFALSVGVENFRGLPDAGGSDNYGVKAGGEVATPFPYLSKYGVGLQIGGSYGAYDFAGRAHSHVRGVQSQAFLTAGLFVRPHGDSSLSVGIVYDWMFNNNYAQYAANPTLEQVRGQIAYYITACDELGVWGTYDTRKARKIDHHRTFDFCIDYRAISQGNIFWRHLFGQGVESTVWFGVPLRNRIDRSRSNKPGKYIIGLEFAVPFFESWAIVGRACYMQPGTRNGPVGSREYTSNIAINLVYYFGGDPNISRRDSSAQAWMPYMPTANNSNFFVDSAVKVDKHTFTNF